MDSLNRPRHEEIMMTRVPPPPRAPPSTTPRTTNSRLLNDPLFHIEDYRQITLRHVRNMRAFQHDLGADRLAAIMALDLRHLKRNEKMTEQAMDYRLKKDKLSGDVRALKAALEGIDEQRMVRRRDEGRGVALI